MSRTRVLQAGFDAIYYSGTTAIMRKAWAGMGVIFCLHHVTPGGGLQAGFAPNSNLEITPEFLATLIRLVVAEGYELLSLDTAVNRIEIGQSEKRFAVFTLDDGYRDNLLHALPVFEATNCPFTVYVAPRIADGTCDLWWRGLEAVIAASDQLKCRIGEYQFEASLRTDDAKWQAWSELAPRLQALPEDEQRETIRLMAAKAGVDLDDLCRAAAMTWDELRKLAAHPLATIGAHTINHHNLLKLSEMRAREELVASGLRIEAELQRPVRHFAYPYGNKDAAGPREFRLAAEAGYRSAVVTRLGTVTPCYADHLHALPRVMISGRFQNERTIKTLISGVPGRLANGLRPLNVS